MLKQLIGISVALSMLFVASAVDAAPTAQRYGHSAFQSMRHRAPQVRVTATRAQSRSYRPMSHRAQRPDKGSRVDVMTMRAQSAQRIAPRPERMQVQRELRCVPSKTCGQVGSRPRATDRPRNTTKKQLAKDKSKSSKKF